LISIPLLLIVASTIVDLLVQNQKIAASLFSRIIIFCGHPFTALIIATFLAIYFLGIRLGKSKQEVLDLSTKSLGPAGIIILITGAGGVLKQVLIDSGIGAIMASSIAGSSFSPILLAWLLAAIVRITQGSATVAMITAAGIIAPVLEVIPVNELQRALIVLSIAAGATILSHVNDSGFWLVGKYLGINEKQTLQSWTLMETIISVSGLLLCLLLNVFVR
jgi:Gnt-I system low-affinity gluconate transporter